mmetsp:Transcript_28319/g.31737  ORF Transcript_28319/g.31737 Transcript_28319/m.31737 type:complete len:113 (+) Transcript_28319:76-414(+)
MTHVTTIYCFFDIISIDKDGSMATTTTTTTRTRTRTRSTHLRVPRCHSPFHHALFTVSFPENRSLLENKRNRHQYSNFDRRDRFRLGTSNNTTIPLPPFTLLLVIRIVEKST